MTKTKFFRKAAIAAIIAGPLTAAMATNGYFAHGYGMKAKGMGGAAVANADDAFAGANNPAASAFAGNRLEVGVDLFMPTRSAARTGGRTFDVGSDSNQFYVPEIAFNRAISDRIGAGVTIYGNGGLNTNYGGSNTDCGGGPNTNNPLCGNGRLGIDMMQLVVAPTVAYKLSTNHSVGISPLLIQQQFKAEGLHGFQGMTPSNSTAFLTNNGYDSSSGVGVRVGYLGKVSDAVTVGVAYAPKVAMSKLGKYKELFADGGNFDIPENYNIGVNFRATPAVTIAAEYGVIKYSAVPSVGNPMTSAGQLGTPNGRGFGWSDITVYKLGVQWQQSANLTLRAGLNVGDNPIKARDITFNILAPGVVTSHYTLGGTYALSKDTELTVAYMYAPSNSVSGTSFFGAPMNETIRMGQQSLGIQFGWKY